MKRGDLTEEQDVFGKNMVIDYNKFIDIFSLLDIPVNSR